MNSCNFCQIVFEEKSSLLRHISHKPKCKNFYGDETFNQLRREARLASKRRWKHEHADQENEKKRNQKEKYKKYEQDRYVNVKDRKKSKEGNTFEKVYQAAYSNAHSILWDKLYDQAFEKVFDDAIDQALDETFGTYDFQHLFNKNVGWHYDEDGDGAYEKDCDVYEEIEKAIEDTNDKKMDETLQNLSQKWINNRRLNIDYKCLVQSERKAFTEYFDEFKVNHFNVIQDKAMDDAFSLLVPGDVENFDKVEWKIEQNFISCFEDQLKTFESTDFFEKLEKMAYKIMREENRKLNKKE